MDCEQIQEVLEEYVLGLLSPDQHREVEAHLVNCPDCQARVREYAEIVAELPETLAAISTARLSENVKLNVLAEVERRKAGQLKLEPKPQGEAVVAMPHDDLLQGTGVSESREPIHHDGTRQGRWRSYIWRLGFAMAAMLLVLSIAWSIRLNGVLAQRALRAEFSNLVDQQELVLEVIDSNQTERRVLLSPNKPTDDQLPAYGKVFTREEMPYVVAMAARLPAPPVGKLPLMVDAQRRIGTCWTLTTNEEGFGLLVYEAPDADLIYESAMVTLQPIGSTTPTMPPVLTWEVGE